MTRFRWFAGAAVVVLAVAAIYMVRVGLPGEVPAVSREVRLAPTVAPLPTPTPEWFGSVIAVAVPADAGEAIVLVEPDANGAPRQLVPAFDEIGHLSWSPDGSSLAFAARRGNNWDLYRVARDGTALKRLTIHPAYDDWPAWSPDGKHLAFSSSRDGNLDVYRLAVSEGEPEAPQRLTESTNPGIEPAWSPGGDSIAFAAWHDGWYRVEAVAASGDDRRVVADNGGGSDMRAPEWSPDGAAIVSVDGRYGPGRLTRHESPADDPGDGARQSSTALWRMASRVSAYAWYPESGVLATASDEREGRTIEVWDADVRGRRLVAILPTGAGDISWTRGPMPVGLVEAAYAVAPESLPIGAGSGSDSASVEAVRVPADKPESGFLVLADVDVPGDRIHAGLAADFEAMRADVRSSVGVDYLGTLADLWRPLGYSGSSFFSWHKMGRAFDTQMELRGPGGRRDTVLVREEVRGRTYWRMFLRASQQDGTVGQPLVEAGWTFTAGGGNPQFADEGGRRGDQVPGGYWVDFTAIAGRYGWHRIPSVTHGILDWRGSWTGIDYWHYERRDGLRWFEAARQVYSADELDAELRAERLREHGVSFWRLSRLGFPSDWLSGG